MTILQRLLPQMAERGWGRVVAVGSSAVLSRCRTSALQRPPAGPRRRVQGPRKSTRATHHLNTVHPGRIATTA